VHRAHHPLADSTNWKLKPLAILGAQLRLEAVTDENAIAIIKVAEDRTKTTDEKMRAIYAIDRRAVGWDSPKWARLLGVSAAAIRQTDWWRKERKRLSG